MGRTIQTARTARAARRGDTQVYSPKRRFVETFFSWEIDDTDLTDLTVTSRSTPRPSNERRKTSKFVVVHVRQSDSRYPSEFRGKLLRGVVLHYVPQCDAFVVQFSEGKYCDIFPRINVKPSYRAQKITEVVQKRDGRMCRYTLDSDRVDSSGVDGCASRSETVVNAVLLCKVNDDHVLLAFPDFSDACSWSGYSVCHIKNKQILW